jgi:hypothetical protein
MTGRVARTDSQKGLYILADHGDQRFWRAEWRDCSFEPNDVGHDSKVEFYRSDKNTAIHVQIIT